MAPPPPSATIQDRVAANIRKYRSIAKISQAELAKRSNLDRGYIGEIEHGTRNPTIDVLSRIANSLSVSESALLDVVLCNVDSVGATKKTERAFALLQDQRVNPTVHDLVSSLICIKQSDMPDIHEAAGMLPPSTPKNSAYCADFLSHLIIASVLRSVNVFSLTRSPDFGSYSNEVANCCSALIDALGFIGHSDIKNVGHALERLTAQQKNFTDLTETVADLHRYIALEYSSLDRDFLHTTDRIYENNYIDNLHFCSALIFRTPDVLHGQDLIKPFIIRYIHYDLFILMLYCRSICFSSEVQPRKVSVGRVYIDTLYEFLAFAHLHLYGTYAETTDSARGPGGPGTLWAQRVIRVAAKNLVSYLDSPQLGVSKNTKAWLTVLQKSLLDCDQFRLHTIARRLREGRTRLKKHNKLLPPYLSCKRSPEALLLLTG
jgi:transcriptional regulator with XRE-family HTH domain